MLYLVLNVVNNYICHRVSVFTLCDNMPCSSYCVFNNREMIKSCFIRQKHKQILIKEI